MSLREPDLFDGTRDKVEIALGRLIHFEPPEGYYLAFSGGKDSIVIKALAEFSGVRYDAHYSVTTIDPPELVRFIRKHHQDVAWERPEEPLLRKLERRGFPQRQRRWCCEHYKENGGNDRFVVTGIRAAESYNRSNRRMMEPCIGGGYKGKNKTFLHPILDWTDDDVWQFITEHRLPYCSLYDEGWARIGCLFCPMASKQRLTHAKRYPRYVALFIKSFEKLYQKRKDRPSMARWGNGEEMFWWWLNDSRKSEDGEQRMLFE